MRGWTEKEDRLLLEGVAAGKSLRQLGREIRSSPASAISRYNRIKGIKFRSDIERSLSKEKNKRETIREIRALFDNRYLPLKEQIAYAISCGYRNVDIAEACGVTQKYVSKIKR